MRAPIGLRIGSRRRALGVSQAALARRVGISASYLNLIERNKRHVGGSLLIRIANELGIDISELSGDAEHRLIAEVEEALADPVLLCGDLALNLPSAAMLNDGQRSPTWSIPAKAGRGAKPKATAGLRPSSTRTRRLKRSSTSVAC